MDNNTENTKIINLLSGRYKKKFLPPIDNNRIEKPKDVDNETDDDKNDKIINLLNKGGTKQLLEPIVRTAKHSSSDTEIIETIKPQFEIRRIKSETNINKKNQIDIFDVIDNKSCDISNTNVDYEEQLSNNIEQQSTEKEKQNELSVSSVISSVIDSIVNNNNYSIDSNIGNIIEDEVNIQEKDDIIGSKSQIVDDKQEENNIKISDNSKQIKTITFVSNEGNQCTYTGEITIDTYGKEVPNGFGIIRFNHGKNIEETLIGSWREDIDSKDKQFDLLHTFKGIVGENIISMDKYTDKIIDVSLFKNYCNGDDYFVSYDLGKNNYFDQMYKIIELGENVEDSLNNFFNSFNADKLQTLIENAEIDKTMQENIKNVLGENNRNIIIQHCLQKVDIEKLKLISDEIENLPHILAKNNEKVIL